MGLPLVINPGDLGHIGDHETIDALLQNIASPFVVAGIAFGTHAARPAAGHAGVVYIETDTGLAFYDNGAAWVALISTLQAAGVIRVRDNVGQLLSNVTSTAVTYASTEWNPGGWTVSASGITVPSAGLYAIKGNVGWAGAGGGERICIPVVNGSVVAGTAWATGVAATSGQRGSYFSIEKVLAANDVVSMNAYQSSGGDLNLDYARLVVRKIGAA